MFIQPHITGIQAQIWFQVRLDLVHSFHTIRAWSLFLSRGWAFSPGRISQHNAPNTPRSTFSQLDHLSGLLVEMQTGEATLENTWGVLKKLKMELPWGAWVVQLVLSQVVISLSPAGLCVQWGVYLRYFLSSSLSATPQINKSIFNKIKKQ